MTTEKMQQHRRALDLPRVIYYREKAEKASRRCSKLLSEGRAAEAAWEDRNAASYRMQAHAIQARLDADQRTSPE